MLLLSALHQHLLGLINLVFQYCDVLLHLVGSFREIVHVTVQRLISLLSHYEILLDF